MSTVRNRHSAPEPIGGWSSIASQAAAPASHSTAARSRSHSGIVAISSTYRIMMALAAP